MPKQTKQNPIGPTRQSPNWPLTQVSTAPAIPTQQETLENQPPDSPPITSDPIPSPTKKKFVEVTPNSLYVREGPNKSYPVRFRLNKGAIAEVIDEEGSWYLILDSDNRRGYCMSVFTKPAEE